MYVINMACLAIHGLTKFLDLLYDSITVSAAALQAVAGPSKLSTAKANGRVKKRN
jgi:hypothetical protein